MIQKTRATWWLCVGGCGLAVGVIVVFVFLRANGSNPLTTLTSDSPAPVSGMEVSEANAATKAPPEVATSMEPALPPLDFPPGSVEEACGLNEFPAYWNGEEDVLQDWNWAVVPTNEKGEWLVLESEECHVALENHINALNPYIFLWGEGLYRATTFIVLENPLTFERIFADPTGDLTRVQDALSRPECLLQGDETNWELKETCHAEALLNFALVNRFCFGEGIDRRLTSAWDDNPTPEEDRFYWKQRLEEEWLKKKCKTVDSTLKLTEYWEPDQMLSYFHDQETPGDDFLAQWAQVQAGLIELSARLGDDTAGVTEGLHIHRWRFNEEGYKYGRYSWLLTSDEWKKFVSKRQPSTDRFLRTFKMLVTVGAHRPDPRDEIEIDWDRVARHLCEPPYYRENKWLYHDKKIPELKSCKEIVPRTPSARY